MLVLASNSPRRKQLLALGGWDFSVLAVQVDEQVQPGELPDAYVSRLAVSKARAAAALLGDPGIRASRLDTVVVAADTAVVDRAVVDREVAGTVGQSCKILGKPVNATEAEAMLRSLRGRSHQVYTGLAVLRVRDGLLLTDVCVTEVPMRNYSDEEILAYIASGDPFDKAGAYAIQHAGFRPVVSLRGCYANVVGLPVCQLGRLLAQAGFAPATACATDIGLACQQAMDYVCEIAHKPLVEEDLKELS